MTTHEERSPKMGNRSVGIELDDNNQSVGRNPRRMTVAELKAIGHKPMSPMKALRLRCLDCCGFQPNEVRLCPAVYCPSWPFRMGKNPWRAPPTEAKRAIAGALAGKRRELNLS